IAARTARDRRSRRGSNSGASCAYGTTTVPGPLTTGAVLSLTMLPAASGDDSPPAPRERQRRRRDEDRRQRQQKARIGVGDDDVHEPREREAHVPVSRATARRDELPRARRTPQDDEPELQEGHRAVQNASRPRLGRDRWRVRLERWQSRQLVAEQTDPRPGLAADEGHRRFHLMVVDGDLGGPWRDRLRPSRDVAHRDPRAAIRPRAELLVQVESVTM